LQQGNPITAEQQAGVTVVTEQPQPPATDPPAPEKNPVDVFKDIDALRKKTVVTAKRRVLPPPVRVIHKPHPNVMFRVSPDENMKLECNLVVDGGGESGANRTYYFVHPDMRWNPRLAPRMRPYTIRVLITQGGQFMLWPIPIVQKGKSNAVKVWESYNRAVALAETKWVSMVWNDDARDFNIEFAEDDSMLPPPAEIVRTLTEMLMEGFAGCVIDSEDHEFMLQLRGLPSKR
jgi:hypothetical protein